MNKHIINALVILFLVFFVINHEHDRNGTMLREEVAVIALRLHYGMDYQPPPATGDVFADMTDVDYWGTKWAEAAYEARLFIGCGEENGKPLFCGGSQK